MIEAPNIQHGEFDFSRVISEGDKTYSADINLEVLMPSFLDRRRLPKAVRTGNLHVDVTESPDAYVFDITLPGLDPKSFFMILKQGSHSSKYTTEDGVRADWDIFLERVREENSEKARIYQGHMQHMDTFREFGANHFDMFWRALNSKKNREIKELFSKTPKVVTPDWWFKNDDQVKSVVNAGKEYGFFIDGPVTEYKWIDTILNKNRGLVKQYPELRGVLLQTFQAFGLYTKQPPYDQDVIKHNLGFMPDIFKKFYSELSEDQRRLFEAKMADDFIVFRSDDPEEKIYQRQTNKGFGEEVTTVTQKEDSNHIRRSYFSSHQVFELGAPDMFGNYPTQLVDEKIVEEPKIAPRVVWSVDKVTGQRQYFCGRFDQNGDGNVIADTMLGRIFVIAASQDVKAKKLPKQLGFEPFGVLMEIKAAQIPAASGYFDQEFLNGSNFIRRAEQLVGLPKTRVK